MRRLADECVSANIVKSLRESGHDVLYVAENAAGLTDFDVVALAQNEQRILITEDKDFGDLIFRWQQTVPGLVLLRINSSQTDIKTIRLGKAIEELGDDIQGHYVVVEPERIRRRKLDWNAPPLAIDSD